MYEALYEATVATGLEYIAEGEVKDKLNAEAVRHLGRVWFRSERPVEEILKLKSICNLFVIIYDEHLNDEDMPSNAEQLETLLMRIGKQCEWRVGLDKWKQTTKFATLLDEILVKDSDLRPKQPNFRVSCNRYGPKHEFTSPEVCSTFGHVVDTYYGWPIKMKNYDLEIMVQFSENHVYVSFTLTPIALDRRNIVSLGYTTLKAATCYALLRVAEITCGDIVIDPMCGSGAIPVECCAAWMDKEWFSYSLAGEIEPIVLGKTKTNLKIFENKYPHDILQLDVTALPIKSNSVDVIVSDLPFGKRHGSKSKNKTLYPALMREMARVTRIESGRAVLLTQDFKSMNFALHKNIDYWTQKRCSFVKIGNLSCYIFLFIRNKNLHQK